MVQLLDCRSSSAAQSPREDATRVLIHDNRQIAPAARDLEIRDVTHQHLVRFDHAGGPKPIWVSRVEVMHIHLGPVSSNRLRADAR